MQNNTFFGHSKASTLIVLDKVSSTNDYSKQLFTNFKPQHPFTAIMAKEQTDGRGQRGASWIADSNKNLTASFVYFPKDISTKDQFIITIISSLAIYDTLKSFITAPIHIKWPNDILINRKKIAGILIENKVTSVGIKQSVIGIGINVFSQLFPAEIMPKTTSIRLENYEFNLTLIDLTIMLQQRLMHYDEIYTSGQINLLWSLYSKLLFQKDEIAKYTVESKEIEGIITGVNDDGRLMIMVDNEIRKYDLKDITYQL